MESTKKPEIPTLRPHGTFAHKGCLLTLQSHHGHEDNE